MQLSHKIVQIKYPLLVLYFLLIVASFYHVFFAHRIIPGVYIGRVPVGGKTFDQAKKVLELEDGKTNKLLIFEGSGKTFEITAADVELRYNWDASISRAFEVGRTGDVFVDTKEKFAGLVKPLYIAAFYDYEEDLLGKELTGIKGDVNVSVEDATFALDGSEVVVNPASDGYLIDDDKLFKSVIEAFDRLTFGKYILPIAKSTPQLYDADIVPLIPQVKTIIASKLSIKKDKLEWPLSGSALIDLLKPKRDSEGKVVLTLNRPRYDALLEKISAEVDVLPKGKVVEEADGRVTKFEITDKGKEINSKEFTELFKDALFNAKPLVELVMQETSAPTNKEYFGIYTLLGEGTSKFTGSANSRKHNLLLAADRTSGVLVPPGRTYSFNRTIGEVSGKTGYDAAYIITGGRTVLGEGGGVCQTSTTLFRAILNTGLPIVTRYPHAYRVKYYELDKPVGFDAAVFQPSLDLQFKNDTPNYILIQAFPKPEEDQLTFKIYGTPDNRTVEITEPVVTNQTPPPEALYQDDPTLKKGITRQVDFAAWGASVAFNRTVKRENEVLFTDEFKSRYQPWRAIFLVGTKED